MPRAPAEGDRNVCGNFFTTRNIRNSVSSVDAGMGMKGQIISAEQCTFQISSVACPQNALKFGRWGPT